MLIAGDANVLRGDPINAYEALRTIQTLVRVVLESDDEGLTSETLAEMQRRILNGIVVVTEKALAARKGDA
jgi:hypothetical protein